MPGLDALLTNPRNQATLSVCNWSADVSPHLAPHGCDGIAVENSSALMRVVPPGVFR